MAVDVDGDGNVCVFAEANAFSTKMHVFHHCDTSNAALSIWVSHMAAQSVGGVCISANGALAVAHNTSSSPRHLLEIFEFVAP